MQIQGSTAIVTGAASGLGAATAELLAERGADVVGCDLPQALESATPAAGVHLVSADVTRPEELVTVLETAVRRPLRIVVNCAGIAPAARILSKRGPHDLALFAKVVQINLIGTFNVMTLAAERIAAAQPVDAAGQRGVIINTASIAGFEGQIGQAAYASSKGGVVGLILPAARDLAQYGIRVNAIAPGIIETPMLATVSDDFRQSLADGVPFPRRLGEPREYASLVAAIVEHDYLNGEVIRMDGGLRMTQR